MKNLHLVDLPQKRIEHSCVPVCGTYSQEEALWDSVWRGVGSSQWSLESTDQVKLNWKMDGEGEGKEQVSRGVESVFNVEPGRSPTNSSSSDTGKLVEVEEEERGRRMRKIFEAMLSVWPT